MKTSNNSPADKEVAKTDTPNALISDNDLLKFFNLEKENVQDFSITHRKDGYVFAHSYTYVKNKLNSVKSQLTLHIPAPNGPTT